MIDCSRTRPQQQLNMHSINLKLSRRQRNETVSLEVGSYNTHLGNVLYATFLIFATVLVHLIIFVMHFAIDISEL